MSEKKPAPPVKEKVAAALRVVIFTVVLQFPALPQEMKIQLYCRKREQTIPWQPLQTEEAVSAALGIGQHNKRPLLNSLVWDEAVGGGKGDYDNCNAPLVELLHCCLRLPEVLLARESGKVAQKNDQQQIAGMLF